jgi:hypothetical protein
MHEVDTFAISHQDPAVGEALVLAMDTYHKRVGDPLEPLKPVLAANPDFLFGHLFRATALLLTSERRFHRPASSSVAKAEALDSEANPRERGITAALRALVDQDWAAASRRFDRVLIDHPTDAFALQTGQIVDFYRGDARNMRDRLERVLPFWKQGMPGYSFVLGMHAFGLEECNQYPDAEAQGRRAVDLEPQDGWAVHAVAHVLEMQGRVEEGIDWLADRAGDWSPFAGVATGFAIHNWWHLALFHLERADYPACLDLLDRCILPGMGDFATGLLDATALLWRLKLLDVPLGNRFEPLAQTWEAKLEAERGQYAFNDFHAALAFMATGRRAALGDLVAAQERAASAMPGSFQAESATVGRPLLAALRDYDEGRFSTAAWQLLDARQNAQRFGGSHAQRDLITQTLIDAARRGGERALARSVVNERLTAKPTGGLGWRLLATLG